MWNRKANENLAALDDERLMMLLQSAAQPERADELFSELFHRYHPRVSSWCSRITRNPERSSDLAQEIFLRAYRYRQTYRGNARVSTWLYTIARNHCLNSMRRLDSDPLGRSDSLPLELIDHSGDVHAGVERTQSFERLWRLVDRTLTALEKRVMALHYGQEITLDVITRELMLSNPSGAKAYLVNAKRKLKRMLGDPGKHCARAA